MDKNWSRIIHEDIPKSLRDSILSQAHEHFAKQKISRYWKWGLSFAVSLCAAAAIWINTHPIEYEYYFGNHEVAFIELEPHEINDMEVVSDLELLENLEVLDQWSNR